MPGGRKLKDKREAYDYVARETPFKSIQEIADDIGVTKQRVHQIQKAIGVSTPFKRMSDALAEIRRLRAILDSSKIKPVA